MTIWDLFRTSHQTDEFANLVGQKGKPEAYYFPPQYNQTLNNFPHTYMGLEPGTTKADNFVLLERWNEKAITVSSPTHVRMFLSDTLRWQIDRAFCIAPGSLVTYRPQVNSDVFAMFQSEVEGRVVDRGLLTEGT